MTGVKKTRDKELEELRADCVRLAIQNSRYELEIIELRRQRHVLLSEMRKADARCSALAAEYEELRRQIGSK